MPSVRINKNLLIVGSIILLLALAFLQFNVPFAEWGWEESLPPHRMTVDPLVYTWHARQVYQNEDIYKFSDQIRGLDKVIHTYPPLHAILVASIGKLTTVHIHHLAWILIILETLWLPLGMFLITKRIFNEKVALITLLLGLFPPYIWFFKTYIGHWGDVFSYFFVPSVLYLIFIVLNKESYWASAIVGILLAGMFMAHASEVVFVSLFIVGFLGILALFNKRKNLITHTIITGGIALLAVIHFFPVILDMVSRQRGLPGAGKIPGYYPEFQIPIWIIIASVIGIILITQNIRKKKFTLEQSLFFSFIIYLFLISSTHILGLGYRLYRQFYSLYFFAIILPALGIYIIAKFIITQLKLTQIETTVIIIGTLILSLSLFHINLEIFSQMASQPIADSIQWEAIEWIRLNTAKDSLIYNTNGFIHGFPFYFINRNIVDSPLDKDAYLNNIVQLCQGDFPESFAVRCGGTWSFPKMSESGQPIFITKRTGWWSFEREEGPICKEYPPTKIEGFESKAHFIPLDYADYILLQYKNTGRWLGQNYDGCMAFFINESLNRGHTVVWSNEKMAVLKVNKSG